MHLALQKKNENKDRIAVEICSNMQQSSQWLLLFKLKSSAAVPSLFFHKAKYTVYQDLDVSEYATGNFNAKL